jgi:molybdopterin-guanine dinucleotide biosynthesis protein A
MQDDCAVVFLAGGQSRRMGRAKAWLEFDGRPLLAHLIERVADIFPELLVVSAPDQELPPTPARVLHDQYPGDGPIAGMAVGLRAASRPLALVSACDTPFLNPTLAAYMAGLAEGYDAVVPEWGGRVHPLQAIYRTGIYPLLEQSLAEGRHRAMELLPLLHVRSVPETEVRVLDPEGLSFLNMNTPEEYERALKLWPRH